MIILLFAVLIAVAASWGFFARGEIEHGLRKLPENGSTVLISPWLLPLWFLMWVPVILLMTARNHVNLYKAAGLLVVELMLLCVYYTLLLCFLPLLRRCFSARACAALWVLPNELYLLGSIYNLKTSRPLLTVTLPKHWLKWIIPVWFAGFVLVLLWQIISHLLYRRHLLRDAQLVCSKDILPLWHNMQERCKFKHLIPIVVSPHTGTPLTVGLLRSKMHLVLPHLNYTPEELTLILSHELRHIQRDDTQTKMFIGFCTALCWFNPFMWLTRRRVSEDLELSCDELVLSDADEATRAQYANLLLNTAGSSRGYTTCLSSAAISLRYRLKNVVNPRKVLSGTLLVGLVLGAVILCTGTVSLADTPGTVQSLVFDRTEHNQTNNIYFQDEPVALSDARKAELTGYLASLPVREVYLGEFHALDTSDDMLEVSYHAEAYGRTSSILLHLYDGYLRAYVPHRESGRLTLLHFLIDEEIDWDYVSSLIGV